MKEKNNKLSEVLIYLEDIIKKRSMTKEKSYTSDFVHFKLF